MGNCLSEWFPMIERAGVPVPRTSILKLGDGWPNLIAMLDGKSDIEELSRLASWIEAEAKGYGFPCFLRTGQTSAKHSWSKSCFLQSTKDIRSHIANIVEFSECCCFMGIPYDVWVVREMLPTKPLFRCSAYGGFPVVREYRFFVDGGKVVCHHPYWPTNALRDGRPDDDEWEKSAQAMYGDPPAKCFALAQQVAEAVPGYWSVDLIDTERGWYVTDMAVGGNSWHWPDCVNSR